MVRGLPISERQAGEKQQLPGAKRAGASTNLGWVYLQNICIYLRESSLNFDIGNIKQQANVERLKLVWTTMDFQKSASGVT
jgi:hypothetical protein